MDILTNKCGIYKIENNINHHIYIGQSLDIKKRWREHKYAASDTSHRDHNLPVHLAMYKYGLENFSLDIVEICLPDKDVLNQKEIFWINYYNSYYKGYNATLGGDDKNHLGKVVEAYDLEGKYLTSYPNAAEAARKIGVSYSVIQQVLHQKRKSCKELQLKYKDSNIQIKKYNSCQGGVKQVYQYDKNFNLINTYKSIAEASRQTNCDSSTISKVCRGKLKSTGGYIWRYEPCESQA